MKDYKIVTDSIETRSAEQGKEPRYIVNGTALMANNPSVKKYFKNSDGSFRTLKEIFTPNCIKSIKEQAKHKKVFVDVKHKLARDASIRAIAKDKLSNEEMESIELMLNNQMLPLAKVNDVEIEGDKLQIYTELNPLFQSVNMEHKNYFDAIWYSLEKGYLNGISANFADFKIAKDENGNDVIDDLNVLGFSYEDNPSSHIHSITEVAMRALEDGTQGVKMEELKQIEAERLKLQAEKEAFAKEKETVQKAKEEMEKKAELEKQISEQKKIEEELAKKTEELKKISDELHSVKGQVTQKPNPNVPSGKTYDNQFYMEKLKQITARHDSTIATLRAGKQPMRDETMSGFAELINLQAQAGSLTADLSDKDAEYIKENKLLDRSSSDMILNR